MFLILVLQVLVPSFCVKPIFKEPAWHFVAKGGAKPVTRGPVGGNKASALPTCKLSRNYEINSTEFRQFLPACMEHLKTLVHKVDASYTDVQLETVLETECEHEKNFPLVYEDGFQKTSHCKDFACLLVDAREAELRKDGWVVAYNKACEAYWFLQHPKKVEQKAPVFNDETMPAVSTTLLCIINLTLQYFGLYTALVIVRTLNSFKIGNLSNIQQVLEAGCTTVTYAPMLCVLFLGARMRAIQLSQGQTEKYGLPQPWVQTSMVVASTALVAQVVLVLVVGFMHPTQVATDKEGNLDTSSIAESAHPLALKLLTIARYVVMAMLYGGFTSVVLGVFMMDGPKEIWGNKQVPVSPAVMCTIMLSGLFFFVYLIVAITRTCFELSRGLRSSRLLLALQSGATQAKMTVNLAPMLCILFIGARMRALQIDPKNGNPQTWAQKCFFMCTVSVLVQTILVIVLPFVAKGECKPGTSEGDVSFNMQNQIVGIVLTAVRYACLLALYGGTAAVVFSVFVIEHPDGPAKTPPVSPAMQCVINLTVQYFFIYIMLFACITIKSFSMGNTVDAEQGLQTESEFSKIMTKAIGIFDAAKGTVMFAPMLAILFIGARMRALQLARAKDGTISPQAGPQAWVQDGMFLATWAVFVQLLMAIVVPILSGADKPEVDADGNVKVPQNTHKSIIITAEIVRYLSLFFMYGGSMLVVIGIFMMTPNTLPPHSKEHLVPGAEVPKPPVPASAHGF